MTIYPIKNGIVTESKSRDIPVPSGSYRGDWTWYSVSIPFSEGVEVRFTVKNKSEEIGLPVIIVITEGMAYVREAVDGR